MVVGTSFHNQVCLFWSKKWQNACIQLEENKYIYIIVIVYFWFSLVKSCAFSTRAQWRHTIAWDTWTKCFCGFFPGLFKDIRKNEMYLLNRWPSLYFSSNLLMTIFIKLLFFHFDSVVPWYTIVYFLEKLQNKRRYN